MLGRKKTGSVVCRSCGRLVGVGEKECPHCGARNPALWGMGTLVRRLGFNIGFTEIVMGGCATLYLLTLLLSPGAFSGQRQGGPLSFLAPDGWVLLRYGASGYTPVMGLGRWWTVLSAGWLHGNLLHILFNLLWIRQLAPATAEVYGQARMVVVYTAGSVVGFALSSVAPLVPLLSTLLGGAGARELAFGVPVFTVGASAPIFGLFGALIYYGRRGGSRAMTQQILGWALALFLLGYLFRGVDNAAHLGGFAGGYLAGRWLDPLKPERTDHAIAALLCVIATLAAIAASFLFPIKLGP